MNGENGENGEKKSRTENIKALKCSKCGGDITKTHRVEGEGEDEEYIPIAKCLGCGTEFDQHSQEYYEYYSDMFTQDKDKTLFKLGLKGFLNGVEYEIIGRIRYQDEEEYEVETWDEWLAISADGVYHYFVEEDGKIESFSEYVPESIDLESDPANIIFEGKKIPKEDTGFIARIVYAEGELPWQPEIGEPMQMYDFKKDGFYFTVEQSEDEVSITKGEPVSHKEIIDAFGRDEYKDAYNNTIAKRKQYRYKSLVYAGAAVLCLVYSIYACSSGEKVAGIHDKKLVISDNKPWQDKEEQENLLLSQILYGPVVLDKKNSLYEIEVAANPAANTLHLEEQSYNIMLIRKDRLDKFIASGKALNALDGTQAELESFSFGGVFWDEEGYDDEGHWHESDTTGSTSFFLDSDSDGGSVNEYFVYAELLNKNRKRFVLGYSPDGRQTVNDPLTITITKGQMSYRYFLMVIAVFAVLFAINHTKAKSYNELPFDIAEY